MLEAKPNQNIKIGPSAPRPTTFQSERRQHPEAWAERRPGRCGRTPRCARTSPEAVRAHLRGGGSFTFLLRGTDWSSGGLAIYGKLQGRFCIFST